MEEGLLAPIKRIFILGVVSYLAAVAASRDIECFPIFDSFFLPWALLHLPVMGFCIGVSVMNRSTTLRTSLLCGAATFTYYVMDESSAIHAATGIILYALAVSVVIYLIYFRRPSHA